MKIRNEAEIPTPWWNGRTGPAKIIKCGGGGFPALAKKNF
jgi:hypothetical protein